MSDLISRQAAIDALKAHEDYKGYLHGDFEKILEHLPPARSEQEQKTGRWEEHIFDGVMGHRPHALMCTQCNTISLYAYNFCPYCGAKMDEKGE